MAQRAPTPRTEGASLSKTDRVLVARVAWRALECPTQHFRAAVLNAPSYAIECDLDHQADYIRALLEAWDRRDPHWDFPLRLRGELRDLEDIRQHLSRLDAALPAGPLLLAYMDATRELLLALLDATGASVRV